MICYEELVEHIYHQGFYLIENFLHKDNLKSLQVLATNLITTNQFQPAKIGQHATNSQYPLVRGDTIYWLDNHINHPGVSSFFNETMAIKKALNQHLFLGLVDFDVHFASYAPGTHYKKHIDQFNNKKDRRLSCVYYLNADWQESFGGHLQLYNQTGKSLIKVMPIANYFICFNSDLPHEVHQTTKHRLSITGWMKTSTGIIWN